VLGTGRQQSDGWVEKKGGGDTIPPPRRGAGSVHEPRPGEGWGAAVVFGSEDVVCAADYGAARATERGWKGREVMSCWQRGLRESCVDDMTCATVATY
jgi:hypothetical protein